MALDLPAFIGSQIDVIWAQIASLAVSATVRFPDPDPVYDPDTTSFTKSDTTVAGVQAVIVRYKAREIDNAMVRAGDEKCFIRFSELDGNTFTTDCSIEQGGTTRRVIDFNLLPNVANPKLIVAQLRRNPA